MDEKQYNEYIKQITPTHNTFLNVLKAFLTGGIICTIGQALNPWFSSGMNPVSYTHIAVYKRQDYNTLGKLQYLIARADYKILESRYTEAVELEVLVPFDECAGFEELVTDQTGARTAITEGRQIYYGMDGQDILLFDR